MIIRPIEPRDVDALIEIGRQAHEESEYREMSFDEAKCRALCESAIDRWSFIALVAERDGAIIGMLLAAIAPAYFSTDLTAGDLLFYVLPTHRGSRACHRLCRAYIDMARTLGAKLIFLRNSTGIKPDETGELYERMGFAHVGGIYRMEA